MSNQSLREAAQLAIDAYSVDIGFRASRITREALEQLRAALAQPGDMAQPVAWQPLETAPEGVRVLLGPRNAPVVGVVKHMPDWADEQDSIAHVVHYNGKTLVSNYRCSEWMPLPDSAPQPPAEQGAELSDSELYKRACLSLGNVPAARYRKDLLGLMREVIAADRAAHGSDK